MLDQTDELYANIPCHVLQYVRKNHFSRWYNEEGVVGGSKDNQEIDKIMELVNGKLKALDFKNIWMVGNYIHKM